MAMYTDYDQAMRVKSHLTYLIGNEIIKCFKTPLGLVTWPLAIRRAKNKYKQVHRDV